MALSDKLKILLKILHPARVARAIRRLLPSVIHVGKMASCKKVAFDNYPLIRKSFNRNEESRQAMANEQSTRDLFKDAPWICPIMRSGDSWIEMPELDESSRLDRIAGTLSPDIKLGVAGDALWIILDMLVKGIAHRDFHSGNLFLVEGRQLIIIDFEYVTEYPVGQIPPLPLCYDLIGQGLHSPHATNNMCYSQDTPSRMALRFVLGVTAEDAFRELDRKLLDYLKTVCRTFQKKNQRHTLRKSRTYGSFELPFFSVKPEDAQRDSSKRVVDFGIREEYISGKSILDLGTNIGAMLFTMQKFQPKSSLGIEYDAEKVEAAQRVAAYNGLQSFKFRQGDIDKMAIGEVSADVVFCLAVEAHVQNPDRLYPLLASITKERLYMEGNSTTDVSAVLAKLEAAGFTEVRFLGNCTDDDPEHNRRPLFSALAKSAST